MPINTGWIELYCAESDGTGVLVRIRYDETQPYGAQPIINDPVLGAALIVTNTTGKAAKVMVTGPDGVENTVTIPKNGTKLTAAQLAAFGVTTRADAGYSLTCP